MNNNQEPSGGPLSIMQSRGFWGKNTPTKSRRWKYDVTTRTKEDIKVRVLDPMTYIHNGKAVFTNYRIEIKAPNSVIMALSYSSVRRRYSEFVWLHKKLKDEISETSMPSMPVKKVFGRFAVGFILSRQQSLEEYIHGLIDDNELLSNAHLHLFLQTNFTTNEIESILMRKDREDVNHVIVLATTNQRHEYLQDNRSDSALENSYSSLDITDVTQNITSEVFSSGYHGDDEIPDQSDQSSCISDSVIGQRMLDFDSYSSSSQDFDLSFEEYFEFDDNETKRKRRRRSYKPVVFIGGQHKLVEYLMPISKCHVETYVVYSQVKREITRPSRESQDQRVKKLVNEYEVVSLL